MLSFARDKGEVGVNGQADRPLWRNRGRSCGDSVAVRVRECCSAAPESTRTATPDMTPVGQTRKRKTPETFTTQTPLFLSNLKVHFRSASHCCRLLPSCHRPTQSSCRSRSNSPQHCCRRASAGSSGAAPTWCSCPGKPGTVDWSSLIWGTGNWWLMMRNKTSDGALTWSCQHVYSGCCHTEI